jgi:hypothetical protein
MSLFITSQSQATSAGVWAVEVAPPKIINGVSLGYVGLLGTFEWGPENVVFTPADGGELLKAYAPAGSARNSLGYYAVRGRKNFACRVVRVVGSGAAAAAKTLQDGGSANTVIVAAKYKGALGSSIACVVADPTDGVGTHFKLTFSLTNAVTGTTTEVYDNIDIAALSSTDVSDSALIASLTRSGTNLRPANGSFTLTGGSDGSAPVTADYVGTQASADKGCALFEAFNDVACVCVDGFADGGSITRAAVNAGLEAHADYMGDRMALCDTKLSDTLATEITAISSLRDDRVIFVGAQAQILDDAGNLQTSPWSSFIGSVFVNFEPHQSHAWWDDSVLAYYSAVKGVVCAFSPGASGNKASALQQGICLPDQMPDGRWRLQHDRTASVTSGKQFSVRRRVADYLAKSLVPALASYVNGPNVADKNREIKLVIDGFLGREVDKGHITDFSTDIGPGVNSVASIASGQFAVAIAATSPSPREKIFLLMQVGPTVVVSHS